MFESADVSLVFCGVVYFSDIPRAFIHKLRAFIGEPKAFLPEHVFKRMFISVADVYVVHRPK